MHTRSETSTRRTVLYVEDHAVNVLLMSALFEQRPQLRLVVAKDGTDALRVAPGLRPDLLLIDLRLPDCHGIHLLSLLRKIAGCENVPAVAVTAEFVVPTESSGFCEVWSKPLDLEKVLDRLDVFLAAPDAFEPMLVTTRDGLGTGVHIPHAY